MEPVPNPKYPYGCAYPIQVEIDGQETLCWAVPFQDTLTFHWMPWGLPNDYLADRIDPRDALDQIQAIDKRLADEAEADRRAQDENGLPKNGDL